MKKLLLGVMAALTGLSMNAADYVVYQNGTLGDLKVYGWWNAGIDFNAANPDGDGQVFTFKAEDGGAAASMGINAEAAEMTTGPLHSATLNFEWFATTSGQKYTIRLTSRSEENYSFTTTAENIGKWNKVQLNVAETFPAVAKEWLEDANNGVGYVFSVVMDNGTAESAISFNNIVYTGTDEAWEAPVKEELPKPSFVPVPVHDAASVVALYSDDYPQATTFGIGGWGQATKTLEVSFEGRKAMKVSNFNYLGWELGQNLDLSGCNMMHVDFFAANEGGFGFTPIGGGENVWKAETVKVGEWNSYDVPLSHYTNVNFANVYQVKFDQGSGNEGYIANVYFYKDENIKSPEYGGVWYGHIEGNCTKDSKDYFVTIDYAFTANEDGSIGIEASIEGDEDLDAGHQIHVIGNGADEWVTLTRQDDLWIGKTSSLTFEPGNPVNEMEFYLPYAGGVFHDFVRDYIFGASNQKPAAAPSLRLSASVGDITAYSAVISYTLNASDDFNGSDVKILLNDVVIVDNPYMLENLQQNTEYTHTLKAVAELDGETYESKTVTLSFRTLRDGAVAAVWHGIADGIIANAYLPGENPETDRRNLPISIETTLTYNPDQTMTVDATFHGQLPVGFVPHVTLRGKYDRKPLTLVEGTTYTATTPADVTYEEGEAFDYLYFFIAYDGGDTGNGNAIQGYRAGDTNEGVAYGEAADIDLFVTNSALSIGAKAMVTAVVKDNAGHYLLDEPAVLSVDNDAFSLSGNSLTANSKGIATLTATAGQISRSVTVSCINTADAVNLYTAGCTLESDHANPELAFDNNEGTQVEWNCADGDEHYLTVDLGKVRSVQSIELVWEGASAVEYTITLSYNTPATENGMALVEGDNVTRVFEVNDGEGGAGVTARKTVYNDDLSASDAQFIRLDTRKAFNSGWGIKLKEMRILGNDNTLLAVENIVEGDNNAPVEY
ncbi:MAG: discoidin domain-containing protein, partial [Muribaculaceae bacterium]|nr:discoidin domain-containing protein [Muribaculaceae bacterium]